MYHKEFGGETRLISPTPPAVEPQRRGATTLLPAPLAARSSGGGAGTARRDHAPPDPSGGRAAETRCGRAPPGVSGDRATVASGGGAAAARRGCSPWLLQQWDGNSEAQLLSPCSVQPTSPPGQCAPAAASAPHPVLGHCIEVTLSLIFEVFLAQDDFQKTLV